VWGRRSRRLRAAREGLAAALVEQGAIHSPNLRDAFARVPRERFLPPGPWLVLAAGTGYESTPDADGARVYQDLAIAIDPNRLLNNSQPSLMAAVLEALAVREGDEALHLGCATGYYTALLAELVGSRGRVLAVEISPEIAERARRNLRGWRQVEVRQGDVLDATLPEVDVLWIDAGVTRVRTPWLDALRPGGRLAAPLTAVRAPVRVARVVRNHMGRMLFVRREAEGFAARLGPGVAVMALHGGRDPDEQRLVDAAFRAGGWDQVRSLRRDPHPPERDCWAHYGETCLSKRPVTGSAAAPAPRSEEG
jgi:protein-L-isoaspartate(D-aspartate) O-methyltransferase